MEPDKIDKTFLENLKQLHLLSTIICNESNPLEKFILTVIVSNKKNSNESECECIFKILEKEKIWVKSFNYEQFVKYKNKMGFDGSWKSFFKTLVLAINRTDGGKITVKSSDIGNIILTVYHPLSEELKVKSDILLKKVVQLGSEEFKNLTFDMMYELYESKEIYRNRENVFSGYNNGVAEVESIGGNKNFSNLSSSNNPKNSISQLDFKKNLKRKFNYNLVNPNAKKRKEKGVKFIQDDEEAEENQMK